MTVLTDGTWTDPEIFKRGRMLFFNYSLATSFTIKKVKFGQKVQPAHALLNPSMEDLTRYSLDCFHMITCEPNSSSTSRKYNA